MTNLYRKKRSSYLSFKKQPGAAIFIMTVILLLAAILVMTFISSNNRLQERTSVNNYTNNQAYQAAAAGLDFGLQYLSQNSATIIATATGGAINYGSSNSSLTNVSLTDGSKFSVVYTNPTANKYTLILITARGTSSDGTSTRTLTQLAQQQASNTVYTAMSLGAVTLVGGSTLTNTQSNLNIETGGTVTMNNGASTVTSSGTTSSQGSYGSDIIQNSPTLSSMSESDFFTSIFNTSEATEMSSIQAAGNYYSSGSSSDYSQTLSGKAGVAIWINQSNGTTASLGQGVTIGTPSNPVIIIVEGGSLTIANGVTIYGFVYSSGAMSLAGGAVMTGGMASASTIYISNGFKMTYVPFPTSVGGGGAYSKVPGSWKDF